MTESKRTIHTRSELGTYDANAVNVLIPALPLATGKSFAMSVFSSGDGSAKVLSVDVASAETVTVPAGTFQTFKVRVSGGEAPFVLYVSSDTPRRIVKLEIVGAPVVFELAK